MAKIANEYFKLDPWKVVEEGFDPAYNRESESIFSLGNEYMGVRGCFEEGTSAETLLGSYFNGVYENGKMGGSAHYKGIVTKNHFMINAVDWLYTRVELDGERLDMAASKISGFVRTLDMRDGTLLRKFTWELTGGKKVAVSFLRFLNMEKCKQGFQRISFEPLNFSGDITLTIGSDFNTKHGDGKTEYWQEVRKFSSEDVVAIMGRTVTSGQRIFSGFNLTANVGIVSEMLLDIPKFIGCRVTMPLTLGQTSELTKLVSNVVEKDASVSDNAVWQKGLDAVADQAACGFDAAKEEQKHFWGSVWNKVDIEIDGDDKNQQGIRYCLFQLQQTYSGQDKTDNIGAKGLTGEAYNGHAFWDSETYYLPFYLFNNPKAAKYLLEYRYSTLPQARERAKVLDCGGACYPIATLNGDEACTLWQHASLQFQPSTAVAYGIWHYDKIVGDKEFVYGHGAEMLVEISRFLADRGDWSPKKGKFGYYAVMGPDEFQMMVNNNCYTNYMAQQTFAYTLEVISEMKANGIFSGLEEKLGITAEELANWKKISENMIITLDEKTGIYEQHEGFFDLPHIDIDSIPVTDFPLYHHWSYDRIYRNDMIKQPDVLMFMFLHNQQFSFDAKKVNYEYYEPKTIHESSLSPSIHSVLASELQKHDEAYDLFGFTTRLDLDNYNRNTNEGLHIPAIASAWINIVYGFGGMRSDGEKLLFNPSIPAAWNGYNFRISYKNSVILVDVRKDFVTFKVLEGMPCDVVIYGAEITVTCDGVSIPVPAIWRG